MITLALMMWAQYQVLNKPGVPIHPTRKHFQSCYSEKVTEDFRRPNFVKKNGFAHFPAETLIYSLMKY